MLDLAIIGSGPAGYIAAERAAGAGKKTVLFESFQIGGTCLNVGCIPTKTLLYAAKRYAHALYGEEFGIQAQNVTMDFSILHKRMETVKTTLRSGVSSLLKSKKVEIVQAKASLKGRSAEGFALVDSKGRDYQTAQVIIATGASPARPPIPGAKDSDKLLYSAGFLALKRPPEKTVIIGGGIIGLEFACYLSLLGKKVEVIEMMPQIAGTMDSEAATLLQDRLTATGVVFHLSARVTRIEGGKVFYIENDKETSVEGDAILLSVGRTPNVSGLGLESVGCDFTPRGIKVDEYARTNVPGLYAAGDVTNRLQLAHFASRQARVAVSHIVGKPELCRESAIPAVIYTDPEVATVGLSELQAKAQGIDVTVAKLPLFMSGRFVAEMESSEQGFVKLLADKTSGRLLGAVAVGTYASEYIAAASVAIEAELRACDLRECVIAHPTVGELLRDAADML